MELRDRNLIIAPHPDDCILGCGGFLTLYGMQSLVVYVVLGDHHHVGGLIQKTTITDRLKDIYDVSSYLGFQWFTLFEKNDLHCKLDTIPVEVLINEFENVIKIYKPCRIFLPYYKSFDQDHRVIFDAALTALRPIADEYFVPNVLMYYQPKLNWNYPEHFQLPNIYLSLTDEHVSRKIEALKRHSTQLRSDPHVRSSENIRSIMKVTGSQICNNYAESYYLLRGQI